jgi:small subunit ribosomal protein S17e
MYRSLYIWYKYSAILHLSGDKLGNIRQTFIKNIAIELATNYPKQFKFNDFQHNKKKVEQLSDVNSKLLRNRIAGYITRYLTQQNKGNYYPPISE